jgi:hypothetical protein
MEHTQASFEIRFLEDDLWLEPFNPSVRARAGLVQATSVPEALSYDGTSVPLGPVDTVASIHATVQDESDLPLVDLVEQSHVSVIDINAVRGYSRERDVVSYALKGTFACGNPPPTSPPTPEEDVAAAYGSLTTTAGLNTSPAVAGVPEKAGLAFGTTVAGPLLLFSHTSPNRLTYTGVPTRTFEVKASATILPLNGAKNGEFAAGQLTAGAGAAISDGDNFSINDGTNTIVFEFDNNGVTTIGRVPVPFTGGDTAAQVARAARVAIGHAFSSLRVDPDHDQLAATLIGLAATFKGTAPNGGLSTSNAAAMAVTTQMAGGLDPSSGGIHLYKGGSPVAGVFSLVGRGSVVDPANPAEAASFSGVVSLNSGEYLEVFVNNSVNGALITLIPLTMTVVSLD